MPARVLNGRYRLDEIIGEGGMAVVYRGYDLVLNRIVAIKMLRGQYGGDANFLRRFEREAQAAARLSHPHIANVYDVGTDGDARFIVMEYVHGPNLKELIRRQGPFTVEGAAFILRQVAGALDYAHAHGLVHRDVKPQNILVDQHGVVKVVDFGIAKGMSDANLTEAGTGMGTVHYVSPEQARGEVATAASDVYATGIVLYEMLTKQLPFEADTPVGVAMQHVAAEPYPPSAFNPAIPLEVDDVVLTALAKDPADRFPSAAALADALDNWDRPASPTGAARVMTAGSGVAATTALPRRRSSASTTRGARGGPPPSRVAEQTFRDDIGCVTWLIGSAILIGLIGLVVLGFRLGDFSLFQTSATATSVTQPTAPIVAAATPVPPTPTTTLTVATPIGTPVPTATPGTPIPSATPTPATAVVPYLIGSTWDQATQAAKVGNFQLVRQDVFSDAIVAGRVVDQNPKPQAQLPVGSPITVSVSKGPQYVTIPNVVNQPQAQAQQQLAALGLTVTIAEQGSQTIAQGSVIRTDPQSQVDSGGTVTLYVSVGDKIQVPDVYQQPHQQAVAALQQAGLSVVSVSPQGCSYIRQHDTTFNCQTFPNGGIVSGTLQWKSWVPRGSRIDVAYFEATAP
ncbi:MAG TPA: protein kinase [Thermomicrobiaceae bacterium]|nr:protein kinase [Thermomicrobiaceae bacterium]